MLDRPTAVPRNMCWRSATCPVGGGGVLDPPGAAPPGRGAGSPAAPARGLLGLFAAGRAYPLSPRLVLRPGRDRRAHSPCCARPGRVPFSNLSGSSAGISGRPPIRPPAGTRRPLGPVAARSCSEAAAVSEQPVRLWLPAIVTRTRWRPGRSQATRAARSGFPASDARGPGKRHSDLSWLALLPGHGSDQGRPRVRTRRRIPLRRHAAPWGRALWAGATRRRSAPSRSATPDTAPGAGQLRCAVQCSSRKWAGDGSVLPVPGLTGFRGEGVHPHASS